MKTTQGRTKIVYAVLLALAVVAGSGSRADAFLDKTRFAAHLGVAYFCFHHWVLGPYQQGAFATGAPHRTSTMVKGGAALLFAVHEVRVSEKIARTSKDPLLQKLDGSMAGLMTSFTALGTKLKAGKFAPEDVKGLDQKTTSVGSEAAAGGTPIKDVPVAVPGA